jgi:prephenate dehydratase
MWMMMTYFAFNVPNQPGEVARFVEQLRDAGINLVGLWGYASEFEEDQPRVACVPESPAAFRTFFKTANIPIEEGRTFYFTSTDEAGALVDSLKRISEAGINLDAIEGVSSGDRVGCFIWADERHWQPLEELLI